jgi:diguanylate cyclase (GGDEF)-like protein/PAS domain S-box-containing protein
VRLPLRGMSLLVFGILLGASLGVAQLTREVVSDQERLLLRQRTAEASTLLTQLVSQVRMALMSSAAVVQATKGNPAAAFSRLPAPAGATAGLALVKPARDRFDVVAARGQDLAAGKELAGPAVELLRRAVTTDGLVVTPVFRSGDQRRLGFAMRTSAAPGSHLVYEEYIVRPPGQRREVTASEPFSELQGVLYAGERPDTDQIILVTGKLPLSGPTVEHVVQAGADRWLLVASSNRPLVGSLAHNGPRVLLAGGLLTAMLVAALVEALRRRREYALALVDERTQSLAEDRERLAEVQRIARLGGWEWDVSSDVVTWSEELCRIFGVDPARFETTYEGFLELVHPEDREVVRAAVAASVHTHRPFAFDHRIVRSDGQIRWMEAEGRVELNEAGRVAGMRGTSQDITDRRRIEDQLGDLLDEVSHRAVHDALTGLPNRVLLADRLGQALARSKRTGAGVAALFVDVDRFKLINDSQGHAAGDQLLLTVADRLRRAVRAHDTVARFGGDEFVVVCEDKMAVKQASLVAERIAEVLHDPVVIDGQEIFLTASIGIAVSDGSGSADSLLRDADAAMYRAKEKGRDRCEFFDATMRTEAVARLETQSALHRAFERDELRVFYQPLVEIRSGELVGVEALLRWAHPQRGLISPTSFIPLAEETGLIVPIGRFVLEEAVAQLARWQEMAPGRQLTVNVNLSARQLRHPELVETVATIIAAHGIDPAALCLELTESTFMEDLAVHRETIAGLRALGVRLAIDDFGTGFSSLTYLKRFPVDMLKIDQAFVRGLGIDAADMSIVESVVDLAHALGLVVVAEGVETGEQAAHLSMLHCDLAQGFHFARPQPPEELDPLFRPSPAALETTSTSRT